MSYLDAGNTALGVYELRYARERFDMGFAPNAQILRTDAGFRQDSRRFRDNQSGSADGAASEVNEMPIRRQPVFARVLAHGRDGDTVRQAHVADR
jgi:hypothetical protein